MMESEGDLVRESEKQPPVLDLLQIEPTTACGMECRYCLRKELLERGEIKLGHIDNERVSRALDAVRGQVRTVLFQGWGEPQLAPGLPGLIDKAHDVGAEVYLVTNMQLLKKDVIDRLCPEKGDQVHISLDSVNPNYEARTGGDLRTIISNIKQLRENYPTLPVALNCVVSQENFNDIPGLLNYANEQEIAVNLSPQIGTGLPRASEEQWRELTELARQFLRVSISGPVFEDQAQKTPTRLTESIRKVKQLFVDNQGRVFPSCYEREQIGTLETIESLVKQTAEK